MIRIYFEDTNVKIQHSGRLVVNFNSTLKGFEYFCAQKLQSQTARKYKLCKTQPIRVGKC